uniref:Integral membrane protein n=1 Tax=Strongyloides venezuelensis TaxID=75913 RepID=A0A0K0F6D8_STRVS
MSNYTFYLIFYSLSFSAISLSIFSLFHNNWYTIKKFDHTIGLYGGCIENENSTNFMSSKFAQIIRFNEKGINLNFCEIYKYQKPLWMRRSLVIFFVTILFKIIVLILTLIKNIVASSHNRSWGSSIIVVFILSLAIKFFNLCIIKFGRKQIYTFYKYTKKSTCNDGCLENFDDSLPYFTLGNSYYLEVISTILFIFGGIIFLFAMYKKRKQKYVQVSQNTHASRNESLIQNDDLQSIER